MKRLMPVLLALSVVCVHANAATRNVDYASGTDDTSASPWKTLKFAVDNADAGDEIVLAKGVHPLSANVSVAKPLTIRGEGENWETLVVSASSVRSISFKSDANGTSVRDLTFPGSKSTADGYHEIIFSPHATMTFSNIVFRSIGASPTVCGSARLIYTEGKLTFQNTWVTNCLFKGQADGAFIGLRVGPHTFENCVFADNSTSAAGCIFYAGWTEPVVRNCTFVGNRLSSGYAIYAQTCQPKFENTVAWGNVDSATGSERNFTFNSVGNTKNFKSVCSTPILGWSGTGHLEANPMTYDNGRILAASPCAGAGDPSCATALDILGNPRGATPAIGAFEPAVPSHFVCGVTTTAARAPSITLGCVLEGPHETPCTYAWDLDGDGVFDDSTEATPVITVAGVYQAAVRVTDKNGLVATASYGRDLLVRSDGAMTYYVDYANGDDANSGTTRESAWRNLPTAVAKSQVLAGDTIVLVAGTHRLSSGVEVNKALTICGETGAGEVLITSQGSTVRTLHSSVAGSTFHSFTLAGSKDGTDSEVSFSVETGGILASNLTVRAIGENPVACTADPLWYIDNGQSVYADIWVTNCVLSSAFINIRAVKRMSNWVIANNRTTATGSYGHLFMIQYCSPELQNFTIVGNDLHAGAALYAGGSGTPPMYNCLIWNNYRTSGDSPVLANIQCGTSFTKNFHKNCTTPIDGWLTDDNFNSDPQLQADGLHFLSTSPCNQSGDPNHTTPFDIEGQARGAKPSVGAFEYVAPPGLACGIEVLSDPVVSQPQKLRLRCSVEGTPTGTLTYSWDLDGDDVPEKTGAEIEIDEVGVYQPTVSVFDDGVLKASATYGGKLGVHVNGKATYYVDYALGDDANLGMGPGVDAWKTLSAAAGHLLLLAGDEVVLAKGDHVLASSVQFIKAVSVHGAGENWETRLLASGATRELKLDTAGIFLSNVAIPGAKSDATYPVQIVNSSASTVSNVMATAFGANQGPCTQIFQGMHVGATFTHLWVTNCLFTQYAYYTQTQTSLENSLFANNRAWVDSKNPQLVRVIYEINGSYPVFRYCTIVNNELYDSAAVRISGGTLPEISNCIIWNNVDTKTDEIRCVDFDNPPKKDNIHYNCLNDTNNLTAASNITDDPRFRNAAGRDYRLRVDSPCRNTGLDGAWSEGTTDLLGNPRRFGKRSDRGCFELQNGYGTAIIVR